MTSNPCIFLLCISGVPTLKRKQKAGLPFASPSSAAAFTSLKTKPKEVSLKLSPSFLASKYSLEHTNVSPSSPGVILEAG